MAETEAIDQQMVITLIPVPAVIRHISADERPVVYHYRRADLVANPPPLKCPRSTVRINVGSQVDNFWRFERLRIIDPLPDFAVIFRKTHPQRICLR